MAVANIQLIRERRLVEHVREEVGPYLARRFEELRDASAGRRHPDLRPDGRDADGAGQGERHGPFPAELAVGMICRAHCFDNGLVMRAVGDRMIVAPPLVITRAQVDELVDKARKCLDLTLADVRARGWC